MPFVAVAYDRMHNVATYDLWLDQDVVHERSARNHKTRNNDRKKKRNSFASRLDDLISMFNNSSKLGGAIFGFSGPPASTRSTQ
jgi:hypothetical protein